MRPPGTSEQLEKRRRRAVQLLASGRTLAGEFGMRYHPAHVWKILTRLGWSCQKPERRAAERDETAIER
jgi:transposase